VVPMCERGGRSASPAGLSEQVMILGLANAVAAAGMSTCRYRTCFCFLPTTTSHDDGALLAAETSTIL
jgi:hypothetical protein